MSVLLRLIALAAIVSGLVETQAEAAGLPVVIIATVPVELHAGDLLFDGDVQEALITGPVPPSHA